MESDALYNPTSHMVDDDLSERWSTGKSQSGDEWMLVDFGTIVTLSDVALQHGDDTADYPRNYAVRVSNASQDFNAAVRASGAGPSKQRSRLRCFSRHQAAPHDSSNRSRRRQVVEHRRATSQL